MSKLAHIKEIEKKYSQKTYETNVDFTKPKFFACFPYPYMNGKLHLGHAYTMLKVDYEARFKKINGYIGRTFAPTYKYGDSYIAEPTVARQNYQLEPSLVVKDTSNNVRLFGDYTDLLNKIDFYIIKLGSYHLSDL